MGQIGEEIAEKITPILYHDLMDKYIKLRQEYEWKCRELRNSNFQLRMWRLYASDKIENVDQEWNKLMDIVRGIIAKYGDHSLQYMRAMKRRNNTDTGV